MGLRSMHAACLVGTAWLQLAACSATPVAPEPRADLRPVQLAATVVAPACVKTGDARELVPADATALVGFDVDAFRRSSIFPDVDGMLRGDPTARRILTAAEGCGVGLDAWQRVTVGASGSGDLVFVLEATSLGSDATLDCVAKAIEHELGASPWRTRRARCGTELELAGSRGRAWAPDADTLVVASSGWQSAVDDRMDGRGKPARRGKLAWAFSTVDATRPIWFAADVPSPVAASLGHAGAAMQTIGGTVDFATGLDLQVSAGFSTVKAAKTAADELDAQLSKFALIGPMLGLPSGLFAGLGVTARGTHVDGHARISKRDLADLRRWIDGTVGSSPAAPAPGPRKGI